MLIAQAVDTKTLAVNNMINIRNANKDEVKDLQNLNDELFIDNYKYDEDLDMSWAQSSKGKDYFTKLLQDSDATCLIAEDKNKKVGYIAGRKKEISSRKSNYFEIENMGVIPEYRSKGIGSLLMGNILKIAKSKGFQRAFVNSYFRNKGAIKFYKKNGFLEIDVSLEKNI